MEEIREIPEGWEVETLGNISEVVTDYVANGSFASLKDNVEYKDKEDYAILLRLQDHANNYDGNFVYIDKKSYEFLSKSKVYENDIIIANVGARCGYTFKAPKLSKPMSLAPNSILYRTKQNNEFIYYLLMSSIGNKKINFIKSTTAQPKFNKTDFKQVEIIIPKSKKEQQKIAQILSTLDQNIEKTEQTIEKYKNIKSGLMNDLLTGKIRIKDGKWVKETEFKEVDGVGRIPKDWEVKELKEIIKICYGKDQKSVQDNVNGRYPILGTGGQMGKSVQYLYDKPSVLIGRKGTIDKPRYIEEPFWTVDTLFYTEIYDSYIPKWVYYALKLINFNIYNEATGVPSLNPKTIYKIKLLIPSKNEQKHIVKTITTQDHLIEKEQQYLEKLKKLKSGLMEDLLTGKVRVKIK